MNAVVSSPVVSVPDAVEHDIDFDRRFGGIARLYGEAALQRFRRAHVCVIGVGGVGSWAVEALARSAIGRITMIDLDNVAESNVNRQLHALTDTLGMAKVTALARRIAQINPYCAVTEIEDFVTPDNLDEMIGAHSYDYVIDATDNVAAKVALIVYCRAHGIPMITVGSAGGQTDPTKIEIRDLTRTEQEPLLKKVRRRLRQNHGFPRGTKNKFGIDAVFSTEPVRYPENGTFAMSATAMLAMPRAMTTAARQWASPASIARASVRRWSLPLPSGSWLRPESCRHSPGCRLRKGM
jgi:tRNA A37 threonylcarbamoyladenosine dehydratase